MQALHGDMAGASESRAVRCSRRLLLAEGGLEPILALGERINPAGEIISGSVSSWSLCGKRAEGTMSIFSKTQQK